MNNRPPREFVTLEEFEIEIGGSMKENEIALSLENNVSQWSVGPNGTFIPAPKTVKKLTPGVYTLEESPQIGHYFRHIKFSTNDLVKFEDSVSDEIISDIKLFWTARDKYRELGQRYSRAHLLHGGPGTSKTSTLNIVSKDLIDLGGVVFKFHNPYTFVKCVQEFKKIEPERNVVVLMEDIESVIEEYGESEILNVLDGINSVDNLVFLATTNYPEKLLGRITNRPSRFDRVFEFKNPSTETRKLYLQSLISKAGGDFDLEKWVSDSKDLSVAHIKELFLSVSVFGYEYEKTLKTLKGMKKQIKSKDTTEEDRMGF